MRTIAATFLSSILLHGACTTPSTPSSEQADLDRVQQSEKWHSGESPNLFDPTLNHKLADLPSQGVANVIPWAANYWPIYQDSINFQWDGPNSDSPSKKYAEAFDVDDLEDVVSARHGIDRYRGERTSCSSDDDCDRNLVEACAKRAGDSEGVCIPTWFGICHAWAPVAILEPEPINPVTLNGVTFEVNDIKAYLTTLHDRVQHRFVSMRCNADLQADELELDEFGRPVERQCRDSNPGAFHVILTNYLGIKGESFVYERVIDDEIWNQPLRGYRVLQQRDVSAQEANELLDVENADGSVPTEYEFNATAASFQYVNIIVEYITESPAHVDGNLSLDIDRYTLQDHYEYILELNAQGRIVGGEWIGSSKTKHPDFLWLPTGRRDDSVLGGRIKYSEVKELLNLSINGQGGGGSAGGETISEEGAVRRNRWQKYGPFDLGAGGTIAVNMTGQNDADLYVRLGAEPTTSEFDCRPFENGSEERCEVSGSGEVFVAVRGYAFRSKYELAITVKKGGDVEPPPILGLDLTGAVELDELTAFQLPVEAGQQVEIATEAANDIDLYVQMNRPATTEDFAKRAFTSSGDEVLVFTAPAAGVLHIAVHGWEASDFRLTAN